MGLLIQKKATQQKSDIHHRCSLYYTGIDSGVSAHTDPSEFVKYCAPAAVCLIVWLKDFMSILDNAKNSVPLICFVSNKMVFNYFIFCFKGNI